MEKKSLPLGIKILAIMFLLLTIVYTFLVFAEGNLRHILYIVINLLACIGLVRLKAWSIVCVSISLILEGLSFGISFGLSFAEGYGTDSEAVKAIAIIIGLAIAGTIIVMLIRYMRKSLKQLQTQ